MNNVEILKLKKANKVSNILIIEDNDNCSLLIKELLGLFYNVECVDTSYDLNLSKFIDDLNKIKLIIINFRILKNHNYNFINKIKKSIPVIVITSDNSIDTMEEMKKYNFDDIILKPILAKDLVNKIAIFIN